MHFYPRPSNRHFLIFRQAILPVTSARRVASVHIRRAIFLFESRYRTSYHRSSKCLTDNIVIDVCKLRARRRLSSKMICQRIQVLTDALFVIDVILRYKVRVERFGIKVI